jgi:putative addiction module killer protein
MKVRKTDIFKKWLKKLRDTEARSLILTRIDRLEEGNPGNNRFLGDISEMRINHGPGYRVLQGYRKGNHHTVVWRR